MEFQPPTSQSLDVPQYYPTLVIKQRDLPVNNCAVGGESEDPRFGVPLLRFGCDCANFNEAESHLVEAVHCLAVLVKACRNPDGVFEL